MEKQMDNVLFDFDGTIADTSEGIIKCMHYSFDKLKIPRVADSKIREVIGPPLEDMFRILFRDSDEKIINRAVVYFRDRYSKKGLFELRLFDGIIDLLDYLKKLNKNLSIVTSKPLEFVEIILKNLDIKNYFDCISGVDTNGKIKTKSERIRGLIKDNKLDNKRTIMIGDRPEDIISAKLNGIYSLGVTYGYGKEQDLINEGCGFICHNTVEILEFFKANAEIDYRLGKCN